MPKDNRIDEYILKSSEVIQPVIAYIREVVHSAAPEITENIKWSSPSFERNGKIVCTIMAFKKHLNFMLFHGKQFEDKHKLLVDIGEKSPMKGFKQIQKIEDLPPREILEDYIRTAFVHANP